MHLFKKTLVPGMLLVSLSSSAYAASIVTNGSFEFGLANIGDFTQVNAGDSTSITGWTAGPVSIDYIGTYWQASQGSRSIDLSGNAPGSISQNLTTTVGQTYFVSFDLAGNPDAPDGIPRVGTVNVAVGPAIYFLNFDQSNATRPNMGWQSKQFSFVATTPTTTLTFASTTGDPYGPAIDNVAVVVPLSPASYAGGALMGLLGIGAWLRWPKTIEI